MVIDASVAVPWLIETPFSASARRVRPALLLAPSLLLVETTNVLLRYVKIAGALPEPIASRLATLERVIGTFVDDRELLRSATDIAMDNNHKIYDCLYLALSLERGEPLATADRRLAALAEKLGVSVELVVAE
ncbi:type II toxin-antitoxin system VapC family toxin [Oryzicola mucosus]|uniref:Ribonuclease VapC n=1 Tax=Oryzicola mucosus TaxID=2767425 RepID=A0A8J6U8Y7_9HYPH|nr:type II toxin-antitoxin system VapC family toxin [Oryzicola mucosus]MBD0416352.1 type II toxin-antitoxin system VapC family toxin [Oryzicola mucosus]